MRVVVFTADPALRDTPWWSVLLATPGLEAVLVCRKTRPRNAAAVWRSVRRNVAKHGLIFVPYRVGKLILNSVHHLLARSAPRAPLPAHVLVDEVQAFDVHRPEILERVRAWRPDLGVSLGAKILRPALFGIPARGTINLHQGKVPEFRGAPPGFWELATGADTIGVTVHWVDEGLDTGPVLGSGEAPIYQDDTMRAVQARAAELACRILGEVLHQLALGDMGATPQPPGGRTFRFPTLRQRAALAWRLLTRGAARALAPRRLVKLASYLSMFYLFRPLRDLWRGVTGRHPVRVFTFHRISHLCRDGMTISPENLRRQIAYLRRHHDVVTIEQALELIANRARLRRPVAVLTFDDAYRSVYDVARPLLADLGLPACCFVSSDVVGPGRGFAHDASSPVRRYLEVMTWPQLRELRAGGWSIGGHSASHRRLSECDRHTLEQEIVGPLAVLRERLGIERPPLAYPFGGADDLSPAAWSIARMSGYRACFSNFGGENFPGDDLFRLKRIEIGGDHPTITWMCRVHGIDLGRWRSVWDRARPAVTGQPPGDERPSTPNVAPQRGPRLFSPDRAIDYGRTRRIVS